MFFHVILFHPFRAIGEESTGREIFEEYISYLVEKARGKERRREEEKVIVHIWSSLPID